MISFRILLIACIALLTTSMPMLSAQRHPALSRIPNPLYVPTLTFDVASIRENKTPIQSLGAGYWNFPHNGELRTRNLLLVQLIASAYGDQETDFRLQVIGGPDWIRSERFDIRAASDGAANDRLAKLSDADAKLEKQHMLRMLLEDRFGLKAHVETRQRPVLVLTIAKNGPKLHKAEHPAPPPPGRTVWWGSKESLAGMELVGRGASTEEIASMASWDLRQIVIDQTRLTGKYNFTLRYHGTLSLAENDTGSKWPPLEIAMREQLGLQLKEATAPVEVIVIDHIDKPSAN